MSYIEVKNCTKIYQMGDSTIYANKDISFRLNKAN